MDEGEDTKWMRGVVVANAPSPVKVPCRGGGGGGGGGCTKWMRGVG